MNTSQHPPRDQLVAFGQGRLDTETAGSIADHVADCDSCCEVLSEVPSDTLADQVRAVDADTTVDIRTGKSIVRSSTGGRTEVPEDLVDHPRYRIVRVLGAGGMGTVFQAEHRIMDRPVALKVINRELTNDPEIVQRFRQEVRAAAKLSHPNIVTAHDAEQTGELHFLVMEYVEGIDLARYVKRKGPLSPGLVAHVGRQVAQGLSHAAQHSMVHRDIKPQNLIISKSGRVQILDFGLARLGRKDPERDTSFTDDDLLRSSAAALTMAGSILGTPDYIAPEQATDSRNADIRADIYSLGCTLYFLLTGQPPFPGGTVLSKLLAHQKKTATPIAEIRPDVPARLIGFVEKMMSRLPDDRFNSPADVAKALLPLARSWQNSNKSAPVVEDAERSLIEKTDVGARPGVEPSTRQFDGAAEVATARKSPSKNPLSRIPMSKPVLAGVAAVGCLVAAAFYFFGGDPSALDDPEGPASEFDPSSGNASDAAKRQLAAASTLQLDDVLQTIPLGGNTELKLVVIPAGQFVMGTTAAQLAELNRNAEQPLEFLSQEMPSRTVTIPQPFLLGQTEVTVGQFRVFVKESGHQTDAEKHEGWGVENNGWYRRPGFNWQNMGGFIVGDQHPAGNLSWHDARAFCDWLNSKSHKFGGRRIHFRLPVESEWEYACRAGSADLWFFGPDGSRLADFAVVESNRPQTVGSRRPNASDFTTCSAMNRNGASTSSLSTRIRPAE